MKDTLEQMRSKREGEKPWHDNELPISRPFSEQRKKDFYKKQWGKIKEDPLRWEKYQARQALNKAIASGRVRPRPCAVCGSQDRCEAHHEDHKRKLDVVWLCHEHHADITSRGKKLSDLLSATVESYRPHGR